LPFVDGSFLVALLDERDHWHEAAKRTAPQFMRKRPWRTHALALGEVIAVIGSRAGGRAARDAYDSIRDTVDIWIPTLAELDAAMPHVVRFDGALSLSDALFVESMAGDHTASILSFDSDFDKAGLRRLPLS
jgi:predicted nucleic acid-binding protein